MQFKQPEILYFLIALIIPILVHLFQLQKFKKTVFTNVAFLQKIVQQNRKSSQLKKWLLLLSRLLLFSALIIAFSQPYFSNKKELRNSTVFIYLDNSLSMSSNGEKGELLKNAIQEIIENSNLKTNYSLLTNSSFYRNINANELKNQLLKLNSEAKSLSFKELFLKINTLINDKTNTLDKLILISDFQKYKNGNSIDFTNVTSRFSFVQLNSEQKNNLSIDSLFIKRQNNNDFIINILVRNQGDDKKNIPIAVFNQNQLVAKQSFSIQKDQVKTILFPIQNSQEFFGKITLDFNDTFSFDNSFYFSLNATEKINVLSIGETNEFLSKIYSKNEFNFNTSSVKNIDYNSLQKQQLIILNELNSLSPTLTEYLEKHIAT
ncbi:MAG: BatA domain-containing protein [Flavobacteriaceae bacterium]|nr:BatA domain-containing protein [Flavobacteriaceae bacterium]